MDEILHRASAMATFVLSAQLLACLWYLTFIYMERELENATQPDAEAISFSSIPALVFFMLNRIVPAYGMAIASFHQILGTAEITILEINVAFILINVGWAVLYRLN
ncbi:uncharacterized protein F4807DRAFT_404202 [Annulohypoxylon truncatum]|uniref:uncharacterized protein n=1 Tax=Annulohypoxylon truncatum TaxID=327061 RepID=UPI002008BDB1|nr:uncharacterized protein F4807DRAFT_404202 [Annulohypoxylon truncatum]KAI1214674.1 hypothetical protein F4807DRAFT_404202 [Annulohypoxylon truncatum]